MARRATITFFVRIYGAIIAYFVQLYLAWAMGAAQLGIYVFAVTWLSILSFLTPLGFDTSLVRFLAQYVADKDWPRARGVLQVARRIGLWVSLSVAALGVLLTWLIDPQPYTTPLLIALPAIPIVTQINVFEGMARAFHWVALVATPSFALRPTALLLFSFLAFSLGYQDGASVVFAFVLAACLTLAVQFFFSSRLMPKEIEAAEPRIETRTWLQTSVPMMLVASFELMLANTDIVMMGVIRGESATGVYNIAVRTASCLLFVFFAVSAFAAPKIAALFEESDRRPVIDFARKIRLWIFLPTLATAVVLVLVGPYLFAFFGKDFESAYTPMLLLICGILVRALAGPVDNLLAMTGKEREVAMGLFIATIVNFVGNSILIPRYGATGAASSTAISVTLEIVILSTRAGRHLGFIPFLYRERS